MNPRNFLNFFKTGSGKLLAFAVVFGLGLILFGALRDRHRGTRDIAVSLVQTNQMDNPQKVQTVENPMQPFHPPQPKAEPPVPNPLPARTNESAKVVVERKAEAPMVAPISLFAENITGADETKSPSSVYAPFGRLIPCETVITVDSSSMQTPIIGLITENIYHAGKLIIPAGTEVHGIGQADHQRDRIASGSSWTLVWQTGEEMRIKAIALDREFENSTNQSGWGITDGSAGLRGEVIRSDNLAEIKLFAATFLSGAAGALTEKQQTIFGPIDSPSLNNAPLAGAQDVLKTYAQQIMDTIQRDGFYVRVPSGKQFYLYVLQTIDRTTAALGDPPEPSVKEDGLAPPKALPVVSYPEMPGRISKGPQPIVR